jgi:TPR repeat protein
VSWNLKILQSLFLFFFLIFSLPAKAVDPNYILPFDQLLKDAQDGIPGAQSSVAWEYLFGIRVRPDFQKSTFWLNQLADNNPVKWSILGHIHTDYANPNGDHQLGVEYLKRAAALGDQRAILKIVSLNIRQTYGIRVII